MYLISAPRPSAPLPFEQVVQYAAEAYATSEYGGDWAAEEAIGPPSHNKGDCATLKAGSWAPARRDQGTYQLTVSFKSPVRVTEVAVREHANPRTATGFLQRVEAWTQAEAGRGKWVVAWEAVSEGGDDTACGFDKVISLNPPTALTSRMRLTTQTDSDAWEYVDAVRVVGLPTGGSACRRPNHPLTLSSSRVSELLRRLRLRGGRRERRGVYRSCWLRCTQSGRGEVLLRRRPLELRYRHLVPNVSWRGLP